MNLQTKNPWQKLPHAVYEKHMGHKNVQQLDMLSRIFGGQLALVADIEKPTVAILGITGGNGLSHIKEGAYKTVLGLDINEQYLDICRTRYRELSTLALHQIDLMTEKDRAVALLQNADLVVANLIVKHIHLCNFIEIISKLVTPVVSITIQFNPDGQSLSHSGFEAAFDEIQTHGCNCDALELNTEMHNAKYRLIDKIEHELPNQKWLIRLDYKHMEVTG